MKLSRLLLAMAAAILCAALLAGCGGTSKASYEKDMKSILNKAEKDINKLTSGSSQPTAADIEKTQKTIEKAAKEADDVDPPSEVKDLHKDLVKALNQTADLMGQLAPIMELSKKDPSKLTEKDVKKMNAVTDKFGKLQKEMDRITKAYKKKKYDIGLEEG